MTDRCKLLRYSIFGDEHELFAAHHIVKPPDFDQLLSIRLSGHPLTDEELQGSVQLVVPGRDNHITHRLRAGETVEGHVRARGSEPGKRVQLRVETEFYLETGRLDRPSALEL